LKVKFKIGMMQGIQGAVRFYLKQIDPIFEFYASPINFDPQAPWFPISSPLEYSKELEARLGTYYTLGMAEDHDGLINGRFGEAAYLDQCAFVLREREQMMLSELERFREGLFFVLFDTPDRMQHMFWRFREPDHPANRDSTSPEMASVIEEQYRVYDDIVGKAMSRADDRTLLMVLSDHGMNSFQRGLNLNTWLFENGFLALKKGYQPGEDTDEFFHNIDWSLTKAYSLGLGCIFLNLKGREAEGILNQEQAEETQKAIVRGLSGLRDDERGQVAVRSVVSREQVWSGPYAHESPDLLVNFAKGYRVSWGTPLGGVPKGLFEDNVKRWAGDHVIDPQLIPGILFMNKKFNTAEPDLVDMAPTILAALGLPKGAAMEGENILR